MKRSFFKIDCWSNGELSHWCVREMGDLLWHSCRPAPPIFSTCSSPPNPAYTTKHRKTTFTVYEQNTHLYKVGILTDICTTARISCRISPLGGGVEGLWGGGSSLGSLGVKNKVSTKFWGSNWFFFGGGVSPPPKKKTGLQETLYTVMCRPVLTPKSSFVTGAFKSLF